MRAQWQSVADALRDRIPKLAALMDQACEDVLAYSAFPKEHWKQIASTNTLEWPTGEMKRRSDVVGIFPNDRAVVRNSAIGHAAAKATRICIAVSVMQAAILIMRSSKVPNCAVASGCGEGFASTTA